MLFTLSGILRPAHSPDVTSSAWSLGPEEPGREINAQRVLGRKIDCGGDKSVQNALRTARTISSNQPVPSDADRHVRARSHDSCSERGGPQTFEAMDGRSPSISAGLASIELRRVGDIPRLVAQDAHRIVRVRRARQMCRAKEAREVSPADEGHIGVAIHNRSRVPVVPCSAGRGDDLRARRCEPGRSHRRSTRLAFIVRCGARSRASAGTWDRSRSDRPRRQSDSRADGVPPANSPGPRARAN